MKRALSKLLFLAGVSALLLDSGGAWSQQASGTGPKPGTTYTLSLTPEQLTVLGKALGKLPYEEVRPIIDDLNAQIAKEIQAANAQQKPEPPAGAPTPATQPPAGSK